MSGEAYRKRIEASGRVPAGTAGKLVEHGLALYAVGIVMDVLPGKIHFMLSEPSYTPGQILKIADALLALEEQVDQALDRAGKDT